MRIRNIRSVSGELVFSFDITALSPSRSPKKMTAGVLKKRNYEKLRFAYIRKHQ
jgi:iron only hydrogenase large subunit-like protein